MKRWIILVAASLFLFSCEKNHPPAVGDITCLPSLGCAGTVFLLSAVASDEDGDSLRFEWQSDGGLFTSGADQPGVTWQSPISAEDRQYLFSLTVSDGTDISLKSFELEVGRAQATVSGNVFFAHCLVPIEGVTVTIAGKNVNTNSDGVFLFSDIPVGQQTLEAAKEGFLFSTRDLTIDMTGIDSIIIPMTSERFTGIVHGIINDQAGLPIEGVRIRLLNPDHSDSELETWSAEDGSYQLAMIPLGVRTLAFSKEKTDRDRYEVLEYAIAIDDPAVDLNIGLTRISLVPEVITAEIDSVTWNSAIAGGEVIYDGESEIYKRGVCWSLNPNPSIDNARTTDGYGLGTFISRLYPLVSDQAYYYCAYATNASRQTGYGEVIQFTTINRFGVFLDSRDQTEYTTIEIGDQIWMAENLAYLPEVHAPSTELIEKQMYYVVDYHGTSVSAAKATEEYKKYGVLYNYLAALNGASGTSAIPSGIRGACPEGWHMPSQPEFEIMIEHIGSEVGRKMKTQSGWTENGNGSNESGFTALPAGLKDTNFGSFFGQGFTAYFWTTGYSGMQLSSYSNDAGFNPFSVHYGFSVRCLKD